MAAPHDETWPARRATVWAHISAEPDPEGIDGLTGLLGRLCRAASRDLGVMGAAVQLMSGGGSEGVAAASDDRCRGAAELQFTVGEGPCHDAFAARRPVLTPDLATSNAQRWPGYTSAALEAGVCAVFAFPMQVGGAGLGVLDIFADHPGSLDQNRLALALTYARVATEIMVDGEMTRPDGDLDRGLANALDSRAEIHQAQGMMMVSLGATLSEALVLMRGHAFAHGRPLIELAKEIISGRGHLGDDP